MKRIYDPCCERYKQYEQNVDHLIGWLKSLEKAYNNAGDLKTAAVVRGILVTTKVVFERE